MAIETWNEFSSLELGEVVMVAYWRGRRDGMAPQLAPRFRVRARALNVSRPKFEDSKKEEQGTLKPTIKGGSASESSHRAVRKHTRVWFAEPLQN